MDTYEKPFALILVGGVVRPRPPVAPGRLGSLLVYFQQRLLRPVRLCTLTCWMVSIVSFSASNVIFRQPLHRACCSVAR